MKQKKKKQTKTINTNDFNFSFNDCAILIIGIFFIVAMYSHDTIKVQQFCADRNMTFEIYEHERVCYGYINDTLLGNISYRIKIISFDDGYGLGYGEFNFSR